MEAIIEVEELGVSWTWVCLCVSGQPVYLTLWPWKPEFDSRSSHFAKKCTASSKDVIKKRERRVCGCV